MTLKTVTRDDLRPLFKLKVAPEQRAFVAPNEVSLAQVHYETGATPYVIWAGEARVGFLQVIDMRDYAYREPHDDPQALYLWRLMLGEGHQRRGYGQAAMALLTEMARAAGHPAIETSVVPANQAAMDFYLKLGFARPQHGVEHGVDDEVPLRLSL